jgi:hypothetical protein
VSGSLDVFHIFAGNKGKAINALRGSQCDFNACL